MVDDPALGKLRTGIIGLGNIAWRYDAGRPGSTLTHRSAYAADPRTELVVGFDPDHQARTDFVDATGVATADSLDAFLAQRPDIVSICSPNHLHAGHLRACLEAGVPMIWLEKPATTSAAEGKSLLDLQRERDASTVLVGLQRRYQPAYRRLHELVQGGQLGSCTGISITYSRGLETNGVHLVDLLFQLLGTNAGPRLDGVTPSTANPPSPSFLLMFAGEVPCTVIGLALDHHSIDITLHFTAGRASVLYGGASEIRETRIENPLYPGFYRLAPDASMAAGEDVLRMEALQAFPAMLSDLIGAHEQQIQPASSLESALAAQALVEQILSVPVAK